MQLKSKVYCVFNRTLLISVVFAAGNTFSFSQDKSKSDTTSSAKEVFSTDSLIVSQDTLPAPARGGTAKQNKGLDAIVDYSARDSLRFNVEAHKVYLYGNASVRYETMKLDAAYIEISLKESLLYASGADSSGKKVGEPKFEDAGKAFTSEKMRYNFKTKKGKIIQARTQEGDGYIHGESIKKMDEDVMYIKDGKYTTCNNPDPHFYIKATKLKVIKNNKIITGPAYLAIANTPTPLALPFGFFPNKQGQSSGIIIPTYGQSPVLGFFLTNMGYYLGKSQYFDVKFLADLYMRGSFAVRTITNYNKRYKFNGTVNIERSQFQEGDPDFPTSSATNNLFIRWSHRQDPKASPTSNFSADVNAGSSQNFRKNFGSTTKDFFSNTFKSNINYTKNFTILSKTSSLTLNGSHDQNTNTKLVTVILPQAAFSVSRFNLMKRKIQTGETRWYENIGFSYLATMQNTLTETEDNFFKEQSISKIRQGIMHSVPISTSFKLMKYFSLAPVVNYNDKWYFQTIRKRWDKDSLKTVTDTVRKFDRFGEYSTSASLTTRVYGMYNFHSKRLQAIRHVITPSVSASYRPDYSKPEYGFYDSVQVDTSGAKQLYSRFNDGVYGAPGIGEFGLISLALQNNLEMKIKNKKDTTGTGQSQKIKLLENLSFATSYNIFADSLQWSPIQMNAWTNITKYVNIVANGTLDPYTLDSAARRVNRSQWNRTEEPGRLTSGTVAVNISLTGGTNEKKKKTSKYGTEKDLEHINNYPEYYVDFNIPWSLQIAYNLIYSKPGYFSTVTNSITFSGDLSLTKNWKIAVRSGFDVRTQQLTQTSIDIIRDLHCWEMRFNIIPFGERQSYKFDVNVKAPVLQDLKLTRQRQWYDQPK